MTLMAFSLLFNVQSSYYYYSGRHYAPLLFTVTHSFVIIMTQPAPARATPARPTGSALAAMAAAMTQCNNNKQKKLNKYCFNK